MKKQLLSTALLFVLATTAFSQDTSMPPAAFPEITATSANKTLVLTPVITFDEHPINHNMHIAADSNFYYAINGGSFSSGQINKFDFAGTLLQTYPIQIDGRGLSYNKADGNLYASLYPGDVVRIDDLATGAFTMLFPAAMQNGQASFAISDDGTKFYDFYAGTLRVYSFNTGLVINTITGLLSGAGNFGGDAAVAVDSIYIYTWDATIKTVYVYDTAGTYLQSFTISDGDNGHSIAIANNLLFVSRDGNYNIGTWYGYDLSLLTGIAPAPAANAALTVLPNPFTDELEVRSSEPAEIKIWDVYGRIIYSQKPQILNLRLQTQHWPSGIYFVEVISEKEKVVRKVVKQ